MGYPNDMLRDLPFTADTLLNLLLDTVVVVDAHGRFLYTSASAAQVFGYTPDELHGTYMIELVHPEDRGRTLQTSWQVMSGEPRIGFRNRYLHKDGSTVQIEWSAQWSEEYEVRIAVARRVESP
jgi:PAS domain S-box-containing protein